MMSDDHLAPHGEAQTRFKTLTQFLDVMPLPTFDYMAVSNWKALNDRYKKILSDHRDAVRHNAAASGIIEVPGECEQILGEMMQAFDKFN